MTTFSNFRKATFALIAAPLTAAILTVAAVPAHAISVANCTNHGIKILIFNQNDMFETADKGVIKLNAKQTITGYNVHGKNYHKFKVFKTGLLDGHLGTIRGIDENKKYWVFYKNNAIQLSTSPNNGSCRE